MRLKISKISVHILTVTTKSNDSKTMRHKSISILLKLPIIAAVLLVAACQSDADYIFMKDANAPIEFGAMLHKTTNVSTRADGPEETKGNGLDSTYIAHEPFDMDFFIQLYCEPEAQEPPHTEIGTYNIPSGNAGRLAAKDPENALGWYNLNTPHTFYAWNIPWVEKEFDADMGVIKWDTNEENGCIEPIPVYFHNSSEADGFTYYKNNAALENFIGAKSVPHSYIEHGKYVDLTFYHLVSKIKIANFILIESDGSIQEDLKADVTFIGMPTQATFYPHPEDGSRPYVGKPLEVSEDDGVTYFIDNNATTEDVFYICPEIDFNDILFKVKINNEKYADYDTYYATFDNVKFERTPGVAYDQGDIDSKILHAGEMMTLNITLIPGIGPGLRIIIEKWSTDKPVESEHHVNSGIYSDAEIKEIIDVFVNQKEYDGSDIQEILERFFEMYGWKDDNGQKHFPIFDNVTYDNNILPIWKECILDGMGHTITMRTNSNSTKYVQAPYFNVGPVRDVYLRDSAGNTIYIDSDGYIWTYDSQNNIYVKTANQLTPFEGDERSYDISCKDGTVHKSTYYTNGLPGTGG